MKGTSSRFATRGNLGPRVPSTSLFPIPFPPTLRALFLLHGPESAIPRASRLPVIYKSLRVSNPADRPYLLCKRGPTPATILIKEAMAHENLRSEM